MYFLPFFQFAGGRFAGFRIWAAHVHIRFSAWFSGRARQRWTADHPRRQRGGCGRRVAGVLWAEALASSGGARPLLGGLEEAGMCLDRDDIASETCIPGWGPGVRQGNGVHTARIAIASRVSPRESQRWRGRGARAAAVRV